MTTATHLKRWLSTVTLAASAVVSAPALAAPVLVGGATLNATDDLTVIQDGAQVFQFLDVSVTAGMSVATALATYDAAGFHWATGADVARLYGAFGITYQSIPTTYVILSASIADTANLVSYIGTTLGDAALAWIDDNTASFYHTYSCMGPTTCMPNAFVENTSSFWPSNPEIGVYLVRAQSNIVPEPGTLMLLGLVALGVATTRRFTQPRSTRH